MPFRSVVFELDGTITDSASGIVASYQHALTALGVEVAETVIRQLIGPPLAVAFPLLGVASPDVETAITLYRQYFVGRGM